MVNSPDVGSSFELSPELAEPIREFITERDEKVAKHLEANGFESHRIANITPLWSMNSTCIDSISLRDSLKARGVSTALLFNENATEPDYEIRPGMTISDHKSHLIISATTDAETVYIDPYWQQFFSDLSISMEDVDSNPELNLVPAERVLCYQADQIDDLAGWFGTIVRAAQDKAKRGVLLGKTDMLTRELSLGQLFMGSRDIPLPIDYYTIEELESVARRIWDPKYFRPVADDEIEQLVAATQ